MKKIIAIAIIAVMVFALVSCGASKYEGTYKYEKEILGEKITVELELKSGGKAVMKVDEEESNLKWSVKDKTVTIEGSDESIEGTFSDDGKTISFEKFLDLGKIEFVKQ